MKKGTTKDELFLVKLYEFASKLGNPQEPINRYEIGRAIGQNDGGTYVISRDLAQANLQKKQKAKLFTSPIMASALCSLS